MMARLSSLPSSFRNEKKIFKKNVVTVGPPLTKLPGSVHDEACPFASLAPFFCEFFVFLFGHSW